MDAAEVQVVVTEGRISEDVKERARQKVAALEKYAPRDFLYAQVQFAQRPSEVQSVTAHVLLDVQGDIVQARMHAEDPTECLDLAEKRLEGVLQRLSERLQHRRYEPETTEEGHWRRGALPTRRPDHFPRPEDEREIVERVTHAREPATPDEAAFDLEMLEDEWLLYVDAGTRTDAVIRHLPDEEMLAISAIGELSEDDLGGAYPVRIEPSPPELAVDEALERLRAGDETHVFFLDPATGRGAVVYWRYDGHYGLVRPRDE